MIEKIKGFQKPILGLLLVCITVFVYWQVSGHDFINLDDPVYVTENPDIRNGFSSDAIGWAFTSTRASNWHPVTWLSHILDYRLFGVSPAGHHIVSLLFHLANTLLLFLILSRMSRSVLPGALVAGLFALHPLHIESVAWVAERKDVLSAFFWLLTLNAYFVYTRKPGFKTYAFALALFAAGLMAKPMLVTLPFVLFLLDYWPLARFRRNRPELQPNPKTTAPGERNLKEKKGNRPVALPKSPTARGPFPFLLYEKIPFLVLSFLSCLITFYAQQKGGAVSSLDMVPLLDRMAAAAGAYALYLLKMIYPIDLSVFYPAQSSNGFLLAGSLLLIGVISALVIRARIKYPYLVVGWFWYLGTLVPVIGLVKVGLQSMADRYTYLPLIGIFVMIAWGAKDLAKKVSFGRLVLGAIGCVVVAALAYSTWSQLQYWQNSISLFERAIQLDDKNYLAHNNLGVALTAMGKSDEAARHYREAIRIRPHYDNAHYNLANFLVAAGEKEAAIDHYREAIRIRPDYAKAQNNLGALLFSMGRYEEAIPLFKASLEKDPLNADSYFNIGISYSALKRRSEAIQNLAGALLIRPNYAEAHNEMGIVLATEGKIDEAVVHFREAVSIKPSYAAARQNLAMALKAQSESGKRP